MAQPSLLRFYHPVMRSKRLQKGSPAHVRVGDEHVAVWRDQDGVPRALVDACPHRNAPLSLGKITKEGRIACGYHGWNFDGAGIGNCPSQPSLKCKTNSFHVVEREGTLWIGNDDAHQKSFPFQAFEGFELVGAFENLFHAPLHITMDNFTEDEHFPSVHALLGWEERDWPAVTYEAKIHEDRTEATYIGPQRPSPLLRSLDVAPGDLFHNHFESRFNPVRHTYSSFWTDPNARERRAVESRTVVYMVPEGDKTRFHTFVYVTIAPGSRLRHAAPLIGLLAQSFVRLEWWMDARWVRKIAHTAPTLKGLKLGKFDKTVIANRRLLKTLYYGESGRTQDGMNEPRTPADAENQAS
jgi:phenylpropionate dioxygenase-like ring-hydroxylating dioxygenase large terminal subunit